MVADAHKPDKSEVAFNFLSKFDAAGKIMETDQGIEASEPCTLCVVDGTHCMVFSQLSDGDQVVCAYCKRKAKDGCNARHPDRQHISAHMFAAVESRLLTLERRAAPSVDDMVQALEAQLRAFEDKATCQQNKCSLRDMRVTALIEENRMLREQHRAFEARFRALEFTVGHCSVHGQYLETPL